MKRNLISLFTILFLVFCPFASAFDEQTQEPTVPLGMEKTVAQPDLMQNEEGHEPITTQPKTSDIIDKSAKSPYANKMENVVSSPLGELARMALMFLKVMLAVGICSVIIYFLLLFVRKFYGANQVNNATSNELEDNLKPSNNEQEALRVFLAKTKND